MQWQAVASTDTGRTRQHNEDSFVSDDELGLFVVCDGMGGHAAGDVASKTVTHVVLQEVRANHALIESIRSGQAPISKAETLLKQAVEKASSVVYQLSARESNKKGMGSTCIALLICGEKAVLANVGDSRLYLLRKSEVHQLSEDHTYVQEAVKHGLLSPENQKLAAYQNVLTRAVGPLQNVVVDTLAFEILAGDRLVLCSDGLHNYLNQEDELLRIVDAGPLGEASARLVSHANERGGADNITALVVRIDSPNENLAALERDTLVHATYRALRHIDLFHEMSMSDLVRIRSLSESRSLDAGEHIIIEGEVTHGLYILVDGEVRVERNGTHVATLSSGSHFGEMALLTDRPRSASVVAKSAVNLLILEKQAFHQLLAAEPTIASKFLFKLAQTLSFRLDDLYLLQDSDATTAVTVRDTNLPPATMPPSPYRSKKTLPMITGGRPEKK